MNCDLWFKNINVYFDLDDIPKMWDDFKLLSHDLRRVRWYWRPVWLALVAANIICLLGMLVLIFALFGLYMASMLIRQGIIKITPK